MVLFVDGVRVDEVPMDARALYNLSPTLKESGAAFASSTHKQIGAIGVLYVSQREFAVCLPQDKSISIVGTDDCTTCLAVLLKHASGSISLGHFESMSAVEGISAMVARLQDVSLGYFDHGQIQMHIAGSFNDSRGFSDKVLANVLHYVSKEPSEIHLVTACVGDVNSVSRSGTPWPIVYGIGTNIKTGEVFPATFLDKGPDLPLRHARLFTGSHNLLEIYDYASGLLKIGPFHYEPLRCANITLQESDEFILRHLTTSPEVEPPHVVAQIKQTLQHIQDHPFPEITVWNENRPRYYRKEDSGVWTLVNFNQRCFE